MNDKRKSGEGGMRGWATRRRNGTDSVKKAVAAERERCAQIAETPLTAEQSEQLDFGFGVLLKGTQVYKTAQATIAAAIRRGEE